MTGSANHDHRLTGCDLKTKQRAGICSWTLACAISARHALVLAAAIVMTTAVSAAPAVRSHVNVAFFNGDKPPVDALQAFDAVVLEPSSHFQPVTQKLAHTTWVARIAPSASASPAEIVAQEVEPLWARGYRGFLLDNAAAIAAFDAISTAHPDARLLVGGPDALNAALAHARSTYAVLGQPLASGWDEQAARIVEVPAAERATRAAAAQAFMRQTGVPVLSLEFCERADRQCARRTAIDVVSAGVTPYVTDPGRDVVGIGAIEVLPRKVLVVQDTAPDLPLDLTPGVRNLAMPLNYLGYDVEYVNVNERLPDDITPDRYAGVVAWLEGVGVRDANAWRRWVDARVQAHVPIAFVGQFGFEAAADEGAALDLSPVAGPFSGQVETVMRDAMIGFEIDPGLDARDVAALKVGAASRPLLRARRRSHRRSSSHYSVGRVCAEPVHGRAVDWHRAGALGHSANRVLEGSVALARHAIAERDDRKWTAAVDGARRR